MSNITVSGNQSYFNEDVKFFKDIYVYGNLYYNFQEKEKEIFGDIEVTGNVTGNLIGNVTGNVTGNLIGNVTGIVTATTISTNAITTVAGKPILNSTGSILQVVQSTHSTAATYTSTTYIATGLTGIITPSSTSSKILVMINLQAGSYSSNVANLGIQLQRNGSGVYTTQFGYVNSVNASINMNTYIGFNYLDSPAATSPLTYSIFLNGSINSGPNGNYTQYNFGNSTSFLTLLEVSA